MGKPDLGRLIAQTMAPPAEGRTIEVITGEILDAKRAGGEARRSGAPGREPEQQSAAHSGAAL